MALFFKSNCINQSIYYYSIYYFYFSNMLEAFISPELELIFYIILLISIFSFFSLAPWVPTKSSDLSRIHKILWLKPWEKFLEIWCWTAKVSLYLAKHNPEAHVTGIELSPLLFIFSKLRVYFSGLKNINIIYWNALKQDFSTFDVFYIFGLPETVTKKIAPKLLEQMNDTARFFSYCFIMNNDNFIQTQHKEQKNVYSIYEYTKI